MRSYKWRTGYKAPTKDRLQHFKETAPPKTRDKHIGGAPCTVTNPKINLPLEELKYAYTRTH